MNTTARAAASSGTTEWFHKTHETYGSAPLGSDDASYYLNLTKKAAVEDKTDVLAVRLLATEEGLTWSRVASVVPPIRHTGVRTFVGSRGSVADTSFTDAGEDAAGYGFPPPMSFVFNLTNLAEGVPYPWEPQAITGKRSVCDILYSRLWARYEAISACGVVSSGSAASTAVLISSTARA